MPTFDYRLCWLWNWHVRCVFVLKSRWFFWLSTADMPTTEIKIQMHYLWSWNACVDFQLSMCRHRKSEVKGGKCNLCKLVSTPNFQCLDAGNRDLRLAWLFCLGMSPFEFWLQKSKRSESLHISWSFTFWVENSGLTVTTHF